MYESRFSIFNSFAKNRGETRMKNIQKVNFGFWSKPFDPGLWCSSFPYNRVYTPKWLGCFSELWSRWQYIFALSRTLECILPPIFSPVFLYGDASGEAEKVIKARVIRRLGIEAAYGRDYVRVDEKCERWEIRTTRTRSTTTRTTPTPTSSTYNPI